MGIVSGTIGLLTGKKKQAKKEQNVPGDNREVKPNKTLVQKRALDKMQPYDIREIHSDGDLTIESDGQFYVVTTDGRVFREIKVK